MNTAQAPIRTRQSKRIFWKQCIDPWKRSGLTQDRFCLEHQLKKPTFQYWQTKFKREGNPTRLIPVTIAPDDTSASHTQTTPSSGISLTLKQRFTIQLEERFNSQTLAKLIDLLEAS
jgi:hypothetical protein